MGEGEDSEAKAHDLSGGQEADRSGAASTMGEGEARGMNIEHSPYCPKCFALLLSRPSFVSWVGAVMGYVGCRSHPSFLKRPLFSRAENLNALPELPHYG
jgi:hypothetical protein